MKDIIKDINLVAYCGLYCGACGSYLKERCPGCRENAKASWCRIRTCCIDNKYATCAECGDFTDVNDCKNFNNFFSRLMAVLFRSDRRACIKQIRSNGLDYHAGIMAENKTQTLKRT